MAKKNFYAIKKGIHPETKKIVENLIFKSWDETARYVQGVTEKKYGITAEYKGFVLREEAEEYLGLKEPFLRKKDKSYPLDCLHCYVDGSYDAGIGNYSYGLVCVLGGEVIHFDKGVGKNKEAVSMNQIGGELLGAMNALLFAKRAGYKRLVLFFDYKGVCLHATGIWKRDNEFSESYYQWMQKFFSENKDIEVIFCKVDAHTGDDFNEIADGLAKLALGIKPENVFYQMIKRYALSV